mmetsp:Transcript_18002/g.13032  ORF Transcript_18002/g.13032 Transcript_18002/m.13032 type:complete len:133 (-) Transcript_18002:1926-2324(-)
MFNFANHVRAIFWKRILTLVRNKKLMFVEIVLPIALVVVGVLISKVEIFMESPPRHLSPDLLPWKQKLLVNDRLVQSAPFEEDNIQPAELLKHIPNFHQAFNPIYKDYSQLEEEAGSNKIRIMQEYDYDVFD